MKYILFCILIVFISIPAQPQNHKSGDEKAMKHVDHLKDFQVIEFRRYTIKDGELRNFAHSFESYFPEAFEQMGAIIFGQFLERKNADTFTWIRGFHDYEARGKLNEAFYKGPLWKEVGDRIKDRLIDHTNTLLLRPLYTDRGITILPSVDVVTEKNGAQGIVVAQLFSVKAGNVDAFAKVADEVFSNYKASGAREAGVLVTLDLPNNSPNLPFRDDGPYLVWLGILKDKKMLDEKFTPSVERSSSILTATGLLRGTPELIIMDPTSRSRLRWLSDNK